MQPVEATSRPHSLQKLAPKFDITRRAGLSARSAVKAKCGSARDSPRFSSLVMPVLACQHASPACEVRRGPGEERFEGPRLRVVDATTHKPPRPSSLLEASHAPSSRSRFTSDWWATMAAGSKRRTCPPAAAYSRPSTFRGAPSQKPCRPS